MIQVIGYVELDGAKTFNDKTLAAIYETLKGDGVLDRVFYDKSMKTPDDFIQFMKSPGNYPAMVVVDDKIQGIGWLNGIQGKAAFAHFAFFRESWGAYSEEMGEALMEYWFGFGGESPMLDVLIGQIPAWNKKAISFIKRLGWNVLGNIPHLADGGDMTISYYARQ